MAFAKVSLVLVWLGCASDGADPRSEPLEGYTLIASFSLDDGTIESAHWLASGRILVRSRPNLLTVYDTTGRRITRIGREGAGPGEFRQLSWARPGGRDSIWTYDLTLRRVSLFSEGATLLGSWRVEGTVFGNVEARLRDGSFILVDPYMPMPIHGRRGLRVESVTVSVLRLPDTRVVTISRWPWRSLYKSPATSSLISQPLGPSGMIAESDSTFWAGFGERPLVTEIGHDGIARRELPLSISPMPVSDADRAWARSLGKSRSDFAGVQTLYQEVPLPENWPVMDQIMRDGSRLWIRLPRIADTVEGVWLSQSVADGKVDTLRLAAGVSLLSARAPYIVVRAATPSGDEYLQVYRQKP